MTDFLKRLTLFVLLVSSLVALLILVSDCAVRSRKPVILKVDDHIKYVFSGNSHVECSVNDRLIDNSINIATSGEAYLYSYSKIKSLLEYNNQIKTVFIGCTYGDLHKSLEEKWLFEDMGVVEFVKKYNYILNSAEKSLIFKHNPKAYIRGVTKSVILNFVAFFRSLIPEDSVNSRLINYGGYKHLVRDKLQQDIQLNLTYEQEPFVVSPIQEKYLIMLSELCREKSVRLILLDTPKFPLYYENLSQEMRQSYISLREKLQIDTLLEFSDMVLPDSCYADITHLNYKGAKVFSLYLNDLLN